MKTGSDLVLPRVSSSGLPLPRTRSTRWHLQPSKFDERAAMPVLLELLPTLTDPTRPVRERPPSQHPGLVIGHHNHLLRVGQVDANDRVTRRYRLTQLRQPGIAVAITPGKLHYGQTRTSSWFRVWDPNPNSASGGRLHIPDRHAKPLTMPPSRRRRFSV
jgi:hypothetical protein